MLKKKWTTPTITLQQIDFEKLGDVDRLSNAELAIRMEEAGYQFKKKYKVSENYVHRKIADSDVLISIGSNIANFNGYIQLNSSAVSLWEQLEEPSTMEQMEKVLENRYGISHQQAVEDVIDFLQELKDHDMVTIQ